MLAKLTIDNYALIDKSVIDFHEGFTVITGETGAGKSIMLDALSLLMGARADTKAIGNKERKMVVEAIFTQPDPSLRNICEENDIEWDDTEMIIRREISPAGKSRGFINDTPVNMGTLSAISENILDIHSQHNNSLLNREQEQLSILDAFGDTAELLANYRDIFKRYVALRNRIKKMKEAIEKGKENQEFIKFRLEQLDKLKPKKGELSALEREAEILGDADRIKSELSEAAAGTNNALRYLQNAAATIESIDLDLLDPKGNDNLYDRINSLKIELRDISDTLEGYSEKINSDPQRYEKVQSRIESLYEVMKRFKVKDEEELVELHTHLHDELAAITGDNTDISALEQQLKELAKDLKSAAESLTEKRMEASKKFAAAIMERVAPLGMPNIKFEVDLQRSKMSADGQDTVTFYCSFNKNHPMQPVSEIASGGEIARLMLGIKSIMAEKMNLPTIIFDEIDTGVSGEIAHKMGSMMKNMSEGLQVMAVTHLPQVAANGNAHLKVYKADENEKTVSHIRALSPEERIREIAGMLSGNTINEAALENARALMKAI
ncbi:MAG: DNA repair protein RecN [Muribaculaceae bacterium]|nr:DNA repair protein RecN [Muribaculaceae bacterium]